MSGFTADWLALREPCDIAARPAILADALRGALDAARAHAPQQPLRVLDLGCGTGSNLRFLSSRIPQHQHWTLVDHDPLLLEHAAATAGDAHNVGAWTTLRADLATDLGSLPWQGTQLVTASALLDLVSRAWVDELADQCAAAASAMLFALSYDGRTRCLPGLSDDAWVTEQVNQHQRLDKGFGPALGPEATDHAQRAFEARGYLTGRTRSDWMLETRDTLPLQAELVRGWATAAREIAAPQRTRVDAWEEARLQAIARGVSRIIVGHEDLWGCPR